MRHRTWFVGLLCLTFVSALALEARADAELPSYASIHAGSKVDAAGFSARAAYKYHVHFRHVVALDFDRDGDVDVFTASGSTISLWLNDGSGKLARIARVDGPHGPLLEGQPATGLWDDTAGGVDAPVPSVPRNVLPPAEDAHSPPSLTPSPIREDAARASGGVAIDRSSPRAPPLG